MSKVDKSARSLPEWKRVLKLARHYKAIGTTEVFLRHDSEEKPWHLVTSCEPGGMIRLGVSISVWFLAKDKSGITLRWSRDLEPREANGTGLLQIEIAACKAIFRELPSKPAEQFRKHLATLADTFREEAKTLVSTASDLQARARTLEGI